MGRVIIILLALLVIGLLIYLCVSKIRETFHNAVDYAVTVLFMNGHIDNDTYIAYVSMKANDKYLFLHDYKKLKGFKKGELYSDYSISKKIDEQLNL